MTRNTRDTAGGRAYLDLQNRARRERRPTQEYLTAYVIERWLARLSRSPFVNDFVLKGGVLLAALGERRPTADGDALARNMANDAQVVAARVAEIAAIADDDGVVFVPDTASTRTIRDGALYHGVRVAVEAKIGTARVKLRLDVNFGDPVTPAPRVVELPALRPGMEPVRVLGYPIETALAEKLMTAVDLEAGNTRVRDYADIYTLTGAHDLAYAPMRRAIEATAGFRGTALRPLLRRLVTWWLPALPRMRHTGGSWARSVGTCRSVSPRLSLPPSSSSIRSWTAVRRMAIGIRQIAGGSISNPREASLGRPTWGPIVVVSEEILAH